MQASEDLNATAFKFVQNLAADLSKDDLELPGFPDTVLRLQRALADENTSVKDIVALIECDPALAARIMRLANSAAFNASGHEVVEPRAAVTHLGFNIVRSTATAFAIRQMEQQEWLAPLKPELAKIWQRSNGVAAICHAVAAHVDGIKVDEALATGLFHQLGTLYLMTHAHREGIGVVDNSSWDEVVSGWHPNVARAIIDNWGMPEHVGEAVENQDALADGDTTGLSMMSRLLAAAKLYDGLPEGGDAAAEPLLGTVKLAGASFADLAAQCSEEIASFRQTF